MQDQFYGYMQHVLEAKKKDSNEMSCSTEDILASTEGDEAMDLLQKCMDGFNQLKDEEKDKFLAETSKHHP